MKVFLGCKGQNLFRTVEKTWKKIKPFGHTKALLFFKKGPHLGQNSRPGENDPYVGRDGNMGSWNWLTSRAPRGGANEIAKLRICAIQVHFLGPYNLENAVQREQFYRRIWQF